MGAKSWVKVFGFQAKICSQHMFANLFCIGRYVENMLCVEKAECCVRLVALKLRKGATVTWSTENTTG